LLFDLLDRVGPADAFTAPPGTSLTPLDGGSKPDQEWQVLLSPGLWAAPPAPRPKSDQSAPVAASADQVGQPDAPAFELTRTEA